MAKIDAYLRSIEKFGAAGAVLVSNQPITLKFPTGDRHATQVTPHDQLVGLIREICPPQVLDQVDRQRPVRFEYDSAGVHYWLSVAPRVGAWQVTIEQAAVAAGVRSDAAYAAPTVRTPPPVAAPAELQIERGQYDAPAETARPTASGSPLLDELTRAARAARASDLMLGTGVQPLQRVGTEVTAIGSVIDGDQLSREVGVVAPAAARGAWAEGQTAVFAYGDGAGRVRATLARDQRGPTVALRLLPDEAPLERLGLDPGDWLDRGGLVVIAGPSGAGKTVTLAALVRALAGKQRRVVTIEDPIELVQASPWVSQREIGTHAGTVASGVAAAMAENADAIAIGTVTAAAAATGVIEAAAGGHLVLATITAPTGNLAIERLIALCPEQGLARAVVEATLLGTIVPVVARAGRTFEVNRRGERRT